MSFLLNIFPEGIGFQFVAVYLTGVLSGYLMFRWRERNLLAAFTIKEKTLEENTARQIENAVRAAKVAAGEEVQKIRDEMEQESSAAAAIRKHPPSVLRSGKPS